MQHFCPIFCMTDPTSLQWLLEMFLYSSPDRYFSITLTRLALTMYFLSGNWLGRDSTMIRHLKLWHVFFCRNKTQHTIWFIEIKIEWISLASALKLCICSILQTWQAQSPVPAAAHSRHQPPGQKLGPPPPLDHLPTGGVLQTGEWVYLVSHKVNHEWLVQRRCEVQTHVERTWHVF